MSWGMCGVQKMPRRRNARQTCGFDEGPLLYWLLEYGEQCGFEAVLCAKGAVFIRRTFVAA